MDTLGFPQRCGCLDFPELRAGLARVTSARQRPVTDLPASADVPPSESALLEFGPRPDCRPYIRRGRSRQSQPGAGRCDSPDELKAPARIRRPNEGPQAGTCSAVFEPRGPAPLKSFEKDSGVAAPAAVRVVAEYPEKLVEGLARAEPFPLRWAPSAGNNHPASPPAPDCFQ